VLGKAVETASDTLATLSSANLEDTLQRTWVKTMIT
jgi:hypothetical protein